MRTDPDNVRAAELAVILARALPDASAYRIAVFVIHAQALARVSRKHEERMCSDPAYVERHSDPETGEDLRRPAMQQKADDALALFFNNQDSVPDGWKLETGGDPRGPCCTLHIPGQRGDSMGGGFPIY